MKLTMPFKEIYIRLAEKNEPVFVCTVRYGALGAKVTRFPVEVGPAPELDMEDEAFSMVRRLRRVIPGEKAG